MHFETEATVVLDAEAHNLVQQLEDNKNKIAELTTLGTDYDAVYYCISFLFDHYNYKE